jgi:rod shape-determining protein MreD
MGYSHSRRIEEIVAREIALALGLLLIALMQAALFVRPFGLVPNVVLLLVICRSLLRGPTNAARWAFYGGLSLDLCSISLLGTHTLALLAAALLAALSLRNLRPDNWLLPLFGALLGASAYHAVLAALTAVFVALFDVQTYALVVALPELLATVAAALPFFLVFQRLEERRRRRLPIDVY